MVVNKIRHLPLQNIKMRRTHRTRNGGGIFQVLKMNKIPSWNDDFGYDVLMHVDSKRDSPFSIHCVCDNIYCGLSDIFSSKVGIWDDTKTGQSRDFRKSRFFCRKRLFASRAKRLRVFFLCACDRQPYLTRQTYCFSLQHVLCLFPMVLENTKLNT